MGKSLRNQFIDYMVVNRYADSTVKNYIDIITRLAKFHEKSPDLISSEEIQQYLLYLLKKRKLSWGTVTIIYPEFHAFIKTSFNGTKGHLNYLHDLELKRSPRF